MKAAQYLGPKTIKLTHLDKPKIKKDEILMKTKSVGICGTDLHIYRGGMKELPTPLVPGHEFSGVVEEVGSQVEGFKKGDRITAEHVIPCGECMFCEIGKPNLCDAVEVIGLHRPGALAEYVAIPAELVYQVPNQLDFEEAAMVEPLSIGMYVINETDNLLDKRVAVIGQGPIGMLLSQLLKVAGAYVAGFDVLKFRLDFVQKHKWVDEAVDSQDSYKIKKSLNNFDKSFEVVGREETAEMAIDITRRDGDIYLLGVFEKPAKLDLMQVVKKELNVFGSWTCAFSFNDSIDLLAKGKIDVKSLITHRYSIDEVEKAFRESNEYSQQRIKTVINF